MNDKKNDSPVSGIVSTGKDLVAMLRDGMLLLLAVLLLVWPQTINTMLVKAGFEEGSFLGFKWKAQLEQTDNALVKANTTIADLREQNGKLNSALEEARTQITNPKFGAKIEELNELNARVDQAAAAVQKSVEATTSENAPLIQKAQASTGNVVTWGVVYGGDRKLDAAEYEVRTIAPKLGLSNAAIYFRNNWFRSVATTTDRLQAEQFLAKAKKRQAGSQIVNMSSWCPNAIEEEGYFKCENP